MTTFTVSTPELKRALGLAKAASFPKSQLGCLAGVRIDYVRPGRLPIRLTCTDLELTATASIDCHSLTVGTEPGPLAIVNAKALYDSIPAGKGECTVTIGEGVVTFAFTSGPTGNLPKLKLEEWPRTVDHLKGEVVALAPFADVISAVSTDRVRPVLCQVNVTPTELAATDSYRLNVAQYEHSAGSGLVDGRLVKLILKAAKAAKVDRATLAFSEDQRHATMTIPGFSATHVCHDGDFPPYERLVPKGLPYRIDLADSVPTFRAADKVAKNATPVRLEVNGHVAVTVHNDGVKALEQVLPAGRTDSPDMTVAFNPRYLADALEGTNGLLELIDPLKPALLRSELGVHLLMPVRVS